jgi:hypothetical protein
MSHLFKKHYTPEEARALLPQVREWFAQLHVLRKEVEKQEKALFKLVEPGRDLGGPVVNKWVRNLARLKAVLLQFYRREIQVKDLDRGLIDFPSILEGREVFLCWEDGEEDIGFWHELDSGYAGREPL